MKELSFFTLIDYIVEYFPELKFWDGKGKHEPYQKNKAYFHRQGMPNEIRIEFDGEDKKKNWMNLQLTMFKLEELHYSFAVFYVDGGRSPHLHIYDLDELETLEYDDRTEYRKKFLAKVCPIDSGVDYGLCDEKHLCALEFAIHFKYKKKKELLNYFDNGRNQGIDFDIKWDLQNKVKIKPKVEFNKKQLKFGDLLVKTKEQQIISSLNFETILDKYKVEYKNKMALCPFHADKDMSLSFSNEKKVWNCFGCNEKGDIITFIKKLRGLKNGNKS